MKRSRMRALAPERLSWGGGKSLASTLSTPRPQIVRNNAMWTDLYAPSRVSDLCVASKKVHQVQEWLVSSTLGGMMVLVGSPGIGKSTMVKLLCRKIYEWVEEPSCESPIQSFKSFLQKSMYLDHDTIILIDDLPYLHNEEMQQSFRTMLGTHVMQCPRKTIWIYSDTTGGSHRPKELEALLDPKVLYNSGQVQIVQVHPVTTAKMKKILQQVCNKNRLTLPDVTIYNGDLRHALLSLQFSSVATGQQGRDSRLSPFHALGKLLYAKRVESISSCEETTQPRPPLQYNPEQIIEHSGMPLFSSLYFLQAHAPDFSTNVNQLTQVMDAYSDACLFVNKKQQPMEEYAISLASRASSTFNRSPAPNKFRTFSSPLIFEVNRKARENSMELNVLYRRNTLATWVSTGTFVTDHYSYLRHIHPNSLCGKNLYSMVTKDVFQDSLDAEAEELAKEQAAILALDDIQDFSDDDHDDDNNDENNSQTTNNGNKEDGGSISPAKQEPEIIVID